MECVCPWTAGSFKHTYCTLGITNKDGGSPCGKKDKRETLIGFVALLGLFFFEPTPGAGERGELRGPWGGCSHIAIPPRGKNRKGSLRSQHAVFCFPVCEPLATDTSVCHTSIVIVIIIMQTPWYAKALIIAHPLRPSRSQPHAFPPFLPPRPPRPALSAC